MYLIKLFSFFIIFISIYSNYSIFRILFSSPMTVFFKTVYMNKNAIVLQRVFVLSCLNLILYNCLAKGMYSCHCTIP